MTDLLAETTDLGAEIDVLGELLRALRVSGSLLLRESYAPPFRVTVPDAGVLSRLLHTPADGAIVAFHFAERGNFELRCSDSRVFAIDSGEVAFCFRGTEHELVHGKPSSAIGFEELLERRNGVTFGSLERAGADHSQIVCGALVLHDTQLNPLFAALPDVLHLRPGAGGRLRQATTLLSAELERFDPAAGYVVERLLEVLCAEAVRSCLVEVHGSAGLFRAVSDPATNRALSAFHARPGAPWTIAGLAGIANLSPSRFAARFASSAGVSVMAYVARWRMSLAMRALATTTECVARIAAMVGYGSVPAFSRAFKKHVGRSPAGYRLSPASAERGRRKGGNQSPELTAASNASPADSGVATGRRRQLSSVK